MPYILSLNKWLSDILYELAEQDRFNRLKAHINNKNFLLNLQKNITL